MSDFHSFRHNAAADSAENDYHFRCYIDCSLACVGRDGSLGSEVVEHLEDSNDDNEMVLVGRKIHSVNVVSLVPI